MIVHNICYRKLQYSSPHSSIGSVNVCIYISSPSIHSKKKLQNYLMSTNNINANANAPPWSSLVTCNTNRHHEQSCILTIASRADRVWGVDPSWSVVGIVIVLVMRLVSVLRWAVDFALWIRNSIRRKFRYSNLFKVLRMVRIPK